MGCGWYEIHILVFWFLGFIFIVYIFVCFSWTYYAYWSPTHFHVLFSLTWTCQKRPRTNKRSLGRWERLDWVMSSVRLNVILVDFVAYSASNCQHAGIPAFPPICPDLGTSAHWQTLVSSNFFLRTNLQKSRHRYLKLCLKSKSRTTLGRYDKIKVLKNAKPVVSSVEWRDHSINQDTLLQTFHL